MRHDSDSYSDNLPPKAGFTLIELSIVLVIIGLIVGGVLVGQDLIRAAAVRATISQIEKYQTAVNTFRGKYGELPGDLDSKTATQFGFIARGTLVGQGDNNGVIEAYNSTPTAAGYVVGGDENAVFWVDISKGNLIDGSFTTATMTEPTITSATQIASYFPEAKIGNANYIYVGSGGPSGIVTGSDGYNYFQISGLQNLFGSGFIIGGVIGAQANLTVLQAYNMDAKVDDGLPQSGRVMAWASSPFTGEWAAGTGGTGAESATLGPTTAATAYASTNCYDNNGVVGVQAYSIAKNGRQVNCWLSFRFQ